MKKFLGNIEKKMDSYVYLYLDPMNNEFCLNHLN